MSTINNLSPEDAQAIERLVPHVRKACNSLPSPSVQTAIHAAAVRKVQQKPRVLLFPLIRFAAAAAAVLVVTLTGGLLLHANRVAQTQRRVALMDDMLFLCADDQSAPETAPAGKLEDVARRLLNLQGLGTVSTPLAEVPAELPLPLSRDPQSRNTHVLPAQRYG